MMGLVILSTALVEGCSSFFGSSEGNVQQARIERIEEPAIRQIPALDQSYATSQRPSRRAELAARNATGLPSETLIDVLFDFDRAILREDAVIVLEGNAKRLQKTSVSRLLLEGRGDEYGTSAYNLVLGERRARNVKEYLHDLGLTVELMTTSYGKDRPLCFQHDEDCMQRNRSVHFVVKE
jgi:peptidoglycan-associated lipoprotein